MLLNKYGLLLGTGTGNVNPDGLRFMFELEEISRPEQKILTEKIISYIRGIHNGR